MARRGDGELLGILARKGLNLQPMQETTTARTTTTARNNNNNCKNNNNYKK